MYTIQVQQISALNVLSMQKYLTIEDLVPFLVSSTEKLQAVAEQKGLTITGDVFAIYHGEVNEQQNGPVELCVPVNQLPVVNGGIEAKELPPIEAATVLVTKEEGVFPQILGAYDAVHSWIEQNGRSHAGSPRERYIADWETAGPETAVIEIAWPFQ